MRQNQICKKKTEETYGAVLYEALQVLLKATMRETCSKNFVLAKKKKEDGGRHTHSGDNLGQRAVVFWHCLSTRAVIAYILLE